jgi:hypothetical protein
MHAGGGLAAMDSKLGELRHLMAAARGGDIGAREQMMSEDEVAAILRLSPRTLQRWRQEQLPPQFEKFGGVVRYRLGAIVDFVGGAHTTTGQPTKEGTRI